MVEKELRLVRGNKGYISLDEIKRLINEEVKKLESEIKRIDKLKSDMTYECWINSQLRINRFKSEAELRTLEELKARIEG